MASSRSMLLADLNRTAPPATAVPPDDAVFAVRLTPTGRVFSAPASLTLLAAAEQAGLNPASSCRNGTCRTCLCQLTRGTVRYRIAWPGLSSEEKQQGFILPCVAYPASDLALQWPG